MSFTAEVKNEIMKLDIIDTEKISILSAIIHNSSVKDGMIKITSENNAAIRYIFSLIKDLYNITPKITIRRGYNYNKNYIYILEIHNGYEQLMTDLGIKDNDEVRFTPKEYIIDDESLIRSYIMGAFIICGSINDPKKSRYHLEFIVQNEEYGAFLVKLLNKFDLNAKIIKREHKYMVYIKEAEKIGDFLRIINATRCLLYYEDIRIYRDHKNMTNRLNNCEQANVDKIILTAANQIKDINTIIEEGGIELLDEKAQIVANYRLKYKEASLSELSEIITKETQHPITKSGLSHRMKKITTLAERIRNKNEV